MRRIAALACAFVLALLISLSHASFALTPNTTAPNFTVTDIDGNMFTLSTQTGKAVLINFFFIADGYSLQEIPELKVVRDYYGSNQLVMISIDINPAGDTVAALQTYRTTSGITWIMATDMGLTVSTAYSAYAAPWTFIIDTTGKYQKDFKGLTDSNDFMAEIDKWTNQPPVANFVWTPDSPTPNDPVTFDASGSTDPDGTIASYAWDFGDGVTGTGVGPNHTYTAEGDYTVKLTTTDNNGATAEITRTVHVRRAHAHASVGIKSGDWVKYAVTSTGNPPDVYAFNVTWIKIEFVNVTGTNLTFLGTLQLQNGTEINETGTLDMTTANSFLLIPANSEIGDTIHLGASSTVIAGETTRSYAGASRMILNASVSEQEGNITYFFDKQTGVAVEIYSNYSDYTISLVLTETNLWSGGFLGLEWWAWVTITVVAAIIVVVIILVLRRRRHTAPTPSEQVPPPPPT